ncbi:hypothetical protein PR048_023276 [Dryococelus australis]|uniref:Uncharacterized protein n=1 Tax=Dryococelus australis TaxID=614101 RepID=A0ABQ9GTM3_9NEOP|nr:hypothetical protein PR048_023276 [Dryococelus australis]
MRHAIMTKIKFPGTILHRPMDIARSASVSLPQESMGSNPTSAYRESLKGPNPIPPLFMAAATLGWTGARDIQMRRVELKSRKHGGWRGLGKGNGERVSISLAGVETRTTLCVDTKRRRRQSSPPTKANWAQSPAGSLPGFRTWDRAGRYRWSAGFLGDLPFPPPFHSSAALYSPQSLSLALKTSLLRAAYYLFTHALTMSVRPRRTNIRNPKAGETGDFRENPPSSGIVRHDSHVRKSGSDSSRNREPGSHWWKTNAIAAEPPRPHETTRSLHCSARRFLRRRTAHRPECQEITRWRWRLPTLKTLPVHLRRAARGGTVKEGVFVAPAPPNNPCPRASIRLAPNTPPRQHKQRKCIQKHTNSLAPSKKCLRLSSTITSILGQPSNIQDPSNSILGLPTTLQVEPRTAWHPPSRS